MKVFKGQWVVFEDSGNVYAGRAAKLLARGTDSSWRVAKQYHKDTHGWQSSPSTEQFIVSESRILSVYDNDVWSMSDGLRGRNYVS